jgi:hypothetical protein
MSNLPAKTIKTAPPLLSLFLLLITSLYSSCCDMPPSGAVGDAPEHRDEHNC